jgi:DNA polymerase-3 subunit delta
MGVNPYFMREYEAMARNYSPAKVIKIIHHLREYDMRSKGWNTADNDAGKLMKELVFKIIH